MLTALGYPQERITCLNNAIDTNAFRNDILSVTPDRLRIVRYALGIEANAKVGIFCGSIYPDKRPELLIEAAELIHEQILNFHLIVIGDGPSAPLIDASQ